MDPTQKKLLLIQKDLLEKQTAKLRENLVYYQIQVDKVQRELAKHVQELQLIISKTDDKA